MHEVQEAGAENSTYTMHILYQQDDIESVILQLHQKENNVAQSFFHTQLYHYFFQIAIWYQKDFKKANKDLKVTTNQLINATEHWEL